MTIPFIKVFYPTCTVAVGETDVVAVNFVPFRLGTSALPHKGLANSCRPAYGHRHLSQIRWRVCTCSAISFLPHLVDIHVPVSFSSQSIDWDFSQLFESRQFVVVVSFFEISQYSPPCSIVLGVPSMRVVRAALTDAGILSKVCLRAGWPHLFLSTAKDSEICFAFTVFLGNKR